MNTYTDPHFTDLSDGTRVAHQMWMVDCSTYLHISKEVAQATINTGVIAPSIPAVTLCNKTWTSGNAFEMDQRDNKVCKSCAAKAGK
jgi:hypothetical protein